MNPIINAAPLANLLGIQDNSRGTPVYEPESVPTHLPHQYIFAEKGPTLPQLVSGDSLVQMYGAKTLDPRGPYFNHQTQLVNSLQGVGNQVMLQRVIPADAGPKARLLLSLEIVADTVQTYQRNPDGSYKLDNNGEKIATGTTVPGYIARWVVNRWTVGSTVADFGAVPTASGTLTSSTNTQGQIYPIMELEANFQGAYANNIGLRLQLASNVNDIGSSYTANQIQALLYRLQLVQRNDTTSTASYLNTLLGEPSVTFSLKPNAINPQTDEELSLEDIFIHAYQVLDQRGFPPQYGPFGRIHIYRSNLESILTDVTEAEADVHSASPGAIYLTDIFTGQDVFGNPLQSFLLKGASEGGIKFNNTTTVYADGGSDGTMNFTTFDALVQQELLGYGDLEAKLLDDAAYPQSVIYDSGFTFATKKAMIGVIGKRKDIGVIVSTQDVSAPLNTEAQELSMATALQAYARNFPESEFYGTSVCRAMVIGHAGYLLGSKYRGLLPFSVEVAAKFGRYMGASNGRWTSGQSFDMPPNNQVTMFRDANTNFVPALARSQMWANGLVWAQKFDRLAYFFPAFQTVYDDDTSTLNSARTMFAAIELEKVAQRVWRELTGISSLTEAQFIERSNRLIIEKTQGRFDGSVIVVPTTFFTPADEQRGYSWSCRMDLYSNVLKSVGTFTVTANRLDAYAGANP